MLASAIGVIALIIVLKLVFKLVSRPVVKVHIATTEHHLHSAYYFPELPGPRPAESSAADEELQAMIDDYYRQPGP
jgi:hypothetical protein